VIGAGTDVLAATLGWRLSRHAREKAASRDFTVREVLLAAADPRVRYSQNDYGPGRWMHQRGDVAAVVNIDSMTIVTVLWRHGETWTDDQARDRGEPAA
jgi:hypothetical protein